jgi:hypothetical protein
MNMTQSFSGIDLADYSELIQFASRLSRLFSDSITPLIDYRFVEKAFVRVAGARDLSRQDVSYDAALADSRGVGIKTFGFSTNSGRKLEKVAEFTRDAKNGEFAGLPPEAIATVVSQLRNARMRSDAAEVNVSLSGSFYHCLLRVPGGAMVHEESMDLIEEGAIRPISSSGTELKRFPTQLNDHVRFTDGRKKYTFNRSKNVLMQQFRSDRGFTSNQIDLPIQRNIWDLIGSFEFDNLAEGIPPVLPSLDLQEQMVVLPLYSSRQSDVKEIPAKSGINQWNAGGRERSFGEAYIPIPRKVHDLRPGFFPERDQKFEVRLPSGETVSAKVCQQGSKALMSDPNTVLCNWLFSTIDGDLSYSRSRLSRKLPYTYDDLAKIGKDAVRLVKVPGNELVFDLSFAPVGAYEEFIYASSESDTD